MGRHLLPQSWPLCPPAGMATQACSEPESCRKGCLEHFPLPNREMSMDDTNLGSHSYQLNCCRITFLARFDFSFFEFFEGFLRREMLRLNELPVLLPFCVVTAVRSVELSASESVDSSKISPSEIFSSHSSSAVSSSLPDIWVT